MPSSNEVIKAYQEFLGRTPSQSEINYQSNNSQWSTGAIRNSQEATNYKASGGKSTVQTLSDLENGAVSNETGQQLVGWRHESTGKVSTDPKKGFGNGSVPIWGWLDRGDGYAAGMDEGERVYDNNLRSHGGDGNFVSIPVSDWDNKVDNDWVNNVSSQLGDRFHMEKDKDGKPKEAIRDLGFFRTLDQACKRLVDLDMKSADSVQSILEAIESSTLRIIKATEGVKK